MKLLGLEIRSPIVRSKALQSVSSSSGWWPVIREPFMGAWQQNAPEIDAPRNLLAFSAVFSCIRIISGDISKLRIRLVRRVDEDDDLWEEVRRDSPFLPVLKKPNHYQNRIKFIEQWIISKLLTGNTYVRKLRDQRGIVNALYVLSPDRVEPLVAEDGGVYYRLRSDALAQQGEDPDIVVPASEIIHDLMNPFFHPLMGISPIYASGLSATMGNKIQGNSTSLFANGARPSGIITAPGAISNEAAARIKATWEAAYGGANMGKGTAVFGDGLTYQSMSMPAEDAQLIDQLKWTVEDVARAFLVPMYKLGGSAPTYNNVEALAQSYYNDCLQAMIESLELCLDEGLELPSDLGTEVDLDNLLRMDSSSRFDRHNKAIAGGWFAPNEARVIENMPRAKGGDSPMMQQQQWNLAQLAEREAPVDKPSQAGPPAANDEEPEEEELEDQVAALAAVVIKGLAEEAHG